LLARLAEQVASVARLDGLLALVAFRVFRALEIGYALLVGVLIAEQIALAWCWTFSDSRRGRLRREFEVLAGYST